MGEGFCVRYGTDRRQEGSERLRRGTHVSDRTSFRPLHEELDEFVMDLLNVEMAPSRVSITFQGDEGDVNAPRAQTVEIQPCSPGSQTRSRQKQLVPDHGPSYTPAPS